MNDTHNIGENVMDQEQYDRLCDLATQLEEEGIEFTDDERREFGEVLMEYMTPYDYHENVEMVDDIYDNMFYGVDNLEILSMWLEALGYNTIEDYVEESYLDIPSFEDMIEDIIQNFEDEENYINEHYEGILDFLPDQCVNTIQDLDIVYLFDEFVPNPEDEDDGR